MLSSTTASPRPRPPAKLRRSSTFQNYRPPSRSPSPPPYQHHFPYAPSLPTLLGSPISATSRLIRETTENASDDAMWVNERSREELADLLSRAGSMVKERESELSLTSAVCKSLFESNVLLKDKHDALVSRLPVSRPPTPSDPQGHSRNSSLVSRPWSPIDPQPPRTRATHMRRVSAAPTELAHLAEQNSDLLFKLQELEAEAANADQEGRRKLRMLERELHGLQSELEQTRERSARLEEQIRNSGSAETAPPGLDAELVKLWKKLDREAKVRALKAKARPWDQDPPRTPPRDFAPGSLRSSPVKQFSPARQPANLLLDFRRRDDGSPPSSPHLPMSPSLPSSGLPPNPREFAIVSQLLLKIRELEEANDQIKIQHAETRLKLGRAEQEANEMKRVYDVIRDEVGVELELAEDSPEDEPNAPTFVTPQSTIGKIRLRSINSQNLSQLGSPSRAGGGTLASADGEERLMSLLSRKGHAKSRGSVQGLFSSSEPQDGDAPQYPMMITTGPSLPNISNADPSPSLFFRDRGRSDQLSVHRGIPRLNTAPRSPSICSDSCGLPSPVSVDDDHAGCHTLGSELGDASFLDANWQDSYVGPSTRLRSASLFDCVGTDERSTSGEDHDDEGFYYNCNSDSNSMSDKSKSPARSGRLSFSERSRAHPHDDSPSSNRRSHGRSESVVRKQNHLIVKFIMECWLWLQFIVVISVFVYTVTRKGPKRVLDQVHKQQRN